MKFQISKAKVMSPNPKSSSSSSCSLREVDSVGQVFPPIHGHKEGVKVKVDPQLSNKSLLHRKDRDQARKAVGKRRGAPCRTSNRLRIKQEREEHTRNADKLESEQGRLENQNLFIKYGHNKNPYHKILFLHRLGLSPKSGAPFRRFERISFLPNSLSALENQKKVSLSDRTVGEKVESLKSGNSAKILDQTVRSRDENENHRRQRQQGIKISPVTYCHSVPKPEPNIPGVTDVVKIDYKKEKDPTLLHQNNVKLLAKVPHSGHSTPSSPPLKIPADTDVIVIEVGNEPSHLSILRNSMHKILQQQQQQQFAQNRKPDSSDDAVPYPHRQVTSTTSNKLFPVFAFGQKQKQRSNLSNGCGPYRNNNDANKSKPHQSSLSFKTIAHQMKYRNIEINNATNKPPQKLRPRILRRQVSSLQTSGNVRSRGVTVPVPAQNTFATPVPVAASSIRVLQPQSADEIQVIDLASDEEEEEKAEEELIRIRKMLATWDTEVQIISE